MRSNAEKAAAAKALHDRQRHYDRLHHRDRLKWLSEPSPKWGDGTPVAKHEQVQMTQASHEQLGLIEQHGMSDNSVDLSNGDYLVYLDAGKKASQLAADEMRHDFASSPAP